MDQNHLHVAPRARRDARDVMMVDDDACDDCGVMNNRRSQRKASEDSRGTSFSFGRSNSLDKVE